MKSAPPMMQLQSLGSSARRFWMQLPTWFLLEHPRVLQITILLLGLVVSAWVTIQFLLVEPTIHLSLEQTAVKQLSTQTLDELELVIEERQQEFTQPLLEPTQEIFYGGH